MQTVNLNILPAHARTKLLDFYEFLLSKYAPQEISVSKTEFTKNMPRLGDLAVKLFGTSAGIEIDLPKASYFEYALKPNDINGNTLNKANSADAKSRAADSRC